MKIGQVIPLNPQQPHIPSSYPTTHISLILICHPQKHQVTSNIYFVIMKSSLQLHSSTPIHKQEMTKLITIWQSLQDHNDSIEFRNPVDYKAMGLHDYPQYVKYPMDLSTINRKLRETKYRLVQEVLDDFQLIWDNCKTYNPTNSWIYNLAERLDKAFKKMVKSYLPNIVIGVGAKQAAKDSKQTINDAPKQSEFDDIPQEEVSFQAKYQFVEKLRLISPPSLKIITECITENCAKAFTAGEGGKAQILVDLLDAESFRIVSEKLQEILVTDRTSSKKIKLY